MLRQVSRSFLEIEKTSAKSHVWKSLGMDMGDRAAAIGSYEGRQRASAALHPGIKARIKKKMKENHHYARDARTAFIMKQQQQLLDCPDRSLELVYPQIMAYDRAVEELGLCSVLGMSRKSWFLDGFHGALRVYIDAIDALETLESTPNKPDDKKDAESNAFQSRMTCAPFAAAAHYIAMIRTCKRAFCFDKKPARDVIRMVLDQNKAIGYRFSQDLINAMYLDNIILKQDAKPGDGMKTWIGDHIYSRPIPGRAILHFYPFQLNHPLHRRYMGGVLSMKARGKSSFFNPDILSAIDGDTLSEWVRAFVTPKIKYTPNAFRMLFGDHTEITPRSTLEKVLHALFRTDLDDHINRISASPIVAISKLTQFVAPTQIDDAVSIVVTPHVTDTDVAASAAAATRYWEKIASTLFREPAFGTYHSTIFDETLDLLHRHLPTMFSSMQQIIAKDYESGAFANFSNDRFFEAISRHFPSIVADDRRSLYIVCKDILLDMEDPTTHPDYDNFMEILPDICRALERSSIELEPMHMVPLKKAHTPSLARAEWARLCSLPKTASFAHGRMFAPFGSFEFLEREKIMDAIHEKLCQYYAPPKKRQLKQLMDDRTHVDNPRPSKHSRLE